MASCQGCSQCQYWHRCRENRGVALVDELATFRLSNIRGQHTRRTVAESDEATLFRVGPAEDFADGFREQTPQQSDNLTDEDNTDLI
jgi:hypothetical protein